MQQKAFLKQWNQSFKVKCVLKSAKTDSLNWTKESRIWNKAQMVEEELDQTSCKVFDLFFFTNSELTKLTMAWVVLLHFVLIYLVVRPFSVSAEPILKAVRSWLPAFVRWWQRVCSTSL